MWFKRNSSKTLFDPIGWTERLSELKSSLEFKARALEIEANESSEIASIKKEALISSKKCIELLDNALTSLSEMLSPRDKRRQKEFSEKINDAVYETIDTHSNIATPYDYKTRLLPAIERLHSIISECQTV